MRFTIPKTKTTPFAAILASAVLIAQDVAAYTLNATNVAGLPLCTAATPSNPQYDYIIGALSIDLGLVIMKLINLFVLFDPVGSGAGGGPLAARLAIKGFKVNIVPVPEPEVALHSCCHGNHRCYSSMPVMTS